MSELRKTAEGCLVAVSVHVTLMVVQDENFSMWREILKEVIPHCDRCAKELVPVRDAAAILSEATSPKDQDIALARLRIEVRRYYQVVAAYRHETWKIQGGQSDAA